MEQSFFEIERRFRNLTEDRWPNCPPALYEALISLAAGCTSRHPVNGMYDPMPSVFFDAYITAFDKFLSELPLGPVTSTGNGLFDVVLCPFDRNKESLSFRIKTLVNETLWKQDYLTDLEPAECAHLMFVLKNSVAPLLPAESSIRFRHQWILGEHGAGKTTFISTMLEQDLKRVARGEASIFVMDSQNELVPDLARLKIFAPGQPLHGKLIYLEPDVDYPLHLNIFDFNEDRLRGLDNNQRAILARGSEEMVIFFMRSLVRSDVSGHMETILKYAFRAIKLIPDATVLTLADLLHKGGFEQYERYLGMLDIRTRKFLTKDMFAGQFSASLGGMQARLSALTADDIFNDMFSQPRNTFDLFNELQGAKVILINTKKALLRGATEAFGRFFIAKLLQASEERMMLDRDIRMPVFAYIDEASDYIAQEENIGELIDKARKQKIGLIIANQREKQIESANVLDALSKAAIQARGRAAPIDGNPPTWHVSVSGAEPVMVDVSNVNFRNYPKMTDADYGEMIDEMRLRFSRPPSSKYWSKGGTAPIIDAEYEEVIIREALPPPDEGDTSPKPWPRKPE